MDVHKEQEEEQEKMSKPLQKTLIFLNFTLLALGFCGGPLLLRQYFVKGGRRIWLSSWLETGGWPLFLFPLFVFYLQRRRRKGNQEARLLSMKPLLFVASAFLGILTGMIDYCYAYGMSRLPASTTALIGSTQLAFNAVFSFIIVRQRFTSYSINAVVLLTIGAIVLGLHASKDRPEKESSHQYYVGLFMTLGEAALYGFLLPMVELTYKKAKQAITYPLVMEIQMVMSIFATLFCTVGMIVNKDFQAISREAREYELGAVKYYVVLVWCAIFWQFYYLGAIGVVFVASSLVGGITSAVLLPVLEILAVVLFREKFTAEKGIALVLSLWGFTSYFYGQYKRKKKMSQTPQPDSNVQIP